MHGQKLSSPLSCDLKARSNKNKLRKQVNSKSFQTHKHKVYES